MSSPFVAKAQRIIDDVATDRRPYFTAYYLRVIALGRPADDAEAMALVRVYAAIDECMRRTVC